MSYLELLKLAAPEAVVVVTALIVLAIGLTTERASAFCSVVAALGLVGFVDPRLVRQRRLAEQSVAELVPEPFLEHTIRGDLACGHHARPQV